MRPVLLGMNNPLSSDPRHALYPYPARSAGANLMRIAGIPRSRWLDLFERRNVLPGAQWTHAAARSAGRVLRDELHERCVIILGSEVCEVVWPEALMSRPYQWQRHQTRSGGVFGTLGGWWARLPHPSGRCRDWNSDWHRAAARVFFEELDDAVAREAAAG